MSNHEYGDLRPAQNAASIAAIPVEQLEDDGARGELLRRALAGQDVYGYHAHLLDRWYVWVAQADPYAQHRFRPMEWAQLWREGLQPDTPNDREQL